MNRAEALAKYAVDKDLSGANLSSAYLSGANLSGANLYGANLSYANLSYANLYGANLYGADLYGTNLGGTNLGGADLYGTNLGGTNLGGADLGGADLRDARNIPLLAQQQTLIVPQDGTVIGWKKCAYGVIVRLLIPAKSKRHNAAGRKCRAEYARVLEVIGADVGVSRYDTTVKYVKGKTVRAANYEPDRWQECAGGIHFFITREEAEAYV